MYRLRIKRLLDILLSSIGLILLAIPMAILAMVVKLDSPGPILFWQKRIGLHKVPFQMPKFRTMYIDTPANMPTHLLATPEKWITRSGKIFRKYSLDEIPQILSILTGSMSIIGPRPALWNQDDLISRVSSKVQKKFINSQRSCLSVGFSHFYGCFRHRTPFFSNIMLWICP